MGGRTYPVRYYPIAIRLRDLAFGNIVAMIVDPVNIRATCASALPTHSRSSWGPIIYSAVLCSHYFLSVGTLRVLHSECVPSHSFTQHYLGGIGGLPPFSYICCCHAAAPFAFKPPMRLSL